MPEKREFISTGSKFLDAITGGYGFGEIANIIGDTQVGKSFLGAEAVYQALKEYGKKCKVRFNDVECGLKFDTTDLYGFNIHDYKMTIKNVEQLQGDIGNFTETIKKDEKGFYLVDSFDGLNSIEEMDRHEERKKAAKKGESYDKGTYGGGKPKNSNEMFRTITDELQKTNTALFIVSQIRDNINAGIFEQKWRINGGAGLKFFSSTRLFLVNREDFMAEGRKIGHCLEVYTLKVRSPYPNRKVYINVYHNTGVDNISTVIDYLLDLKNEYGKLDEKKCKCIDYIAGDTPFTSENVKIFCEENNIMEEIRVLGKYTQNRAMAVIEKDPELLTNFVETFGVMTRDQFTQYAIENDMEEELTEKAISKWMEVEERIKPVRPKKTLEL